MTLYLNCIDSHVLNKKQYLLRAAKRLNLDVRNYEGGEVDNILNIEPYDFKEGKRWTGIWEIDLLLDRREMTQENWTKADKIFTAISTVPERMKKYVPELLFQACDPELHKRTQSSKYDVVFLGSQEALFYEERRRVYELIKENCVFKEFPWQKDYIDYYSLARIQFIRSMQTPLGGEIAQRFFECLPIGPILTNYVSDLELTGLVEGEDYLAYRDDREMLEKLRYLISSPEDRERIAENGRHKALANHTFDDRLTKILSHVETV